ncbi:MAG: peptidyl-prolyl cis-trans isomerase [Candidatus Cloacimonetes bacterium]|nr:peptidyl-prolyl cis-trans isomerase [Candidatus Cloacimonadota bacterium]
MMKKLSSEILALIIVLMPLILTGAEIPEDTVIAEFSGGQIYYGDLEFRISKIPSMNQAKYNTNEGKADLLDMMCTEEVFYQEALSLQVEKSTDFNNKLQMKLKNLFSREIKNEFSKNMTISEDKKKNFYQQNKNEFYQDKTYEEATRDIEMRLQPQRFQEMVDSTLAVIKEKYNVIIMYNILDSLDFSRSELVPENPEIIYMLGSSPELQKNLADFAAIYDQLPTKQKEIAQDQETHRNLVDIIIDLELLNWEAYQRGYHEKPELQEATQQIKRNLMLQTVYNLLVVDKVTINDEDLKRYYEDNIDQFSTNAYRKIQTFVFDSKEKAEDMQSRVKKLLKKENWEAIAKLIEAESLYPYKEGVLDHIYHNGIIPGIGKDEIYNDMVWEKAPGKTSPKKLSKIFKNSQGNFVFFRILEDHLSEPKPFVEIVENIRSKMTKELTNERFTELQAELAQKYHLVKYPERMIVFLTAEEYFNLAEESQKKRKFHDAVFYYDQIIKYHQNNTDDYKASFMKAFLYAEELKENKKAIELFQEFLVKYPQGDLHDSANFMLMDLKGDIDLMKSLEKRKD